MLNSSPDLTGNRIAAPKIVRAEDFAKACDGLLEFNDKGEVIYKTCFAAGKSYLVADRAGARREMIMRKPIEESRQPAPQLAHQ